MRKTFITKEYTQEFRAGTFSMLEKRNFFGSKVLELDDIMTVDENNIIWTEAADHTQGVNIDDQTQSLNVAQLKDDNHTLRIYPKQSPAEIEKFTVWELEINIQIIIKEWIFAQLKKFRTFDSIRNTETSSGNVDVAVSEYINYNIMPRIKFSTIYLYIRYFQIGEIDNTGNVALKFDTKYTAYAIIPPTTSGQSTEELILKTAQFKESIKATNFDLQLTSFGQKAKILYKQTNSSEKYKFDYYFDIVYEKA